MMMKRQKKSITYLSPIDLQQITTYLEEHPSLLGTVEETDHADTVTSNTKPHEDARHKAEMSFLEVISCVKCLRPLTKMVKDVKDKSSKMKGSQSKKKKGPILQAAKHSGQDTSTKTPSGRTSRNEDKGLHWSFANDFNGKVELCGYYKYLFQQTQKNRADFGQKVRQAVAPYFTPSLINPTLHLRVVPYHPLGVGRDEIIAGEGWETSNEERNPSQI
eukprot:scaffold245771_cov71-Attheya_sp.AAC.2